jgi:hypothetical protein
LSELGADYDFADLLVDTHWDGSSMGVAVGNSEVTLYSLKAWLLSEMPSIFQHLQLLTEDNQPACSESVALLAAGMPVENIIAIEGWNRRAQAMVKLCRDLGLHFENPPLDVPHQIGGIRLQNRTARALYERLDSATKASLTADLDNDELYTGRYPLVATAAIRATKGDASALPEVIVAYRERQSDLRTYLEEFETRWAHTPTLRGRRELQAELDNAVDVLSRDVGAHQDRLIYRLWHLVKNPTSLLQTIGDRFVSVGRDHAVVGQVRGLRAFWSAAGDAPTADVARTAFSRMMPKLADDKAWSAADELSAVLRKQHS